MHGFNGSPQLCPPEKASQALKGVILPQVLLIFLVWISNTKASYVQS